MGGVEVDQPFSILFLRTGQDYTRDWLETSCKFIVVDSAMSSAVRALTSQISKLTEGGGRAYLAHSFLVLVLFLCSFTFGFSILATVVSFNLGFKGTFWRCWTRLCFRQMQWWSRML